MAAVPTMEAIHQPASLAGIIEVLLADTAGSRNARSAPNLPAAFGPIAPANRITKVTSKAVRGGEEGGGGHEDADRYQGSPGERQTQVCYRLVPPCAAESRHDQGRDPAEGGERGHLEIADDLIGKGEEPGTTRVALSAPHGRVC
jgi:hypothetical protein